MALEPPAAARTGRTRPAIVEAEPGDPGTEPRPGARGVRFRLRNGEVAAEIAGAESAPLVIGIPGLSANLRSFDVIFDALDPERHRTLAYDPRGRGCSEKTPPGTYGWPAHAADIVEMADNLGAETFDLIGWSMGTWIAMEVCRSFPGRVRRLVLIDGGGSVDESAKAPVRAGLQRLGTVYPSFAAFEELARAVGVFEPWERWLPLFRYELEAVPGGLRARTTADAPLEDERWRTGQDPYALWAHVTMPALLVRATREILPGLGYILPQADTDRFLAEVPGARAAYIDAGHYDVGINDDTAREIREFLDEEVDA